MPIYSTNRISGAGVKMVAAEGYTEHDFGRIISECAANDMKLFNAAIARDFQEVRAMQEGTMVSSEIRALQEFSIKEAWKGLVEKLKKLWAKIKGVFRNVYAKLSLWLNRSNKLYVAQHRKYLQTKKNLGECPTPKYMKPKKDWYKAFNSTTSALGELTKVVNEIRTSENPNLKDMIKKASKKTMSSLSSEMDKAFKNETGEGMDVSADKVYEITMKEYFHEPNSDLKFSGCKITLETLFSNLSGSSKYLKDFKKMSNDLDKAFKKIIGDINKMAGDAKEKDKVKYEAASKAVSAFQSLMNAISSGFIKVTKKAISNDRGLIAALVAYDPDKSKNENAIMCEFAYATGFDALHEETEDMDPEDVVDAAEAEGIEIDIEIKGDENVEVNVDDETDD